MQKLNNLISNQLTFLHSYSLILNKYFIMRGKIMQRKLARENAFILISKVFAKKMKLLRRFLKRQPLFADLKPMIM